MKNDQMNIVILKNCINKNMYINIFLHFICWKNITWNKIKVYWNKMFYFVQNILYKNK